MYKSLKKDSAASLAAKKNRKIIITKAMKFLKMMLYQV
ncbi:hypothetical protein SMQC19_46860 (plasmid) [Serratia marcescens]|nr:hypothetical protein SMQC19_46860 [Serratia marcescens]